MSIVRNIAQQEAAFAHADWVEKDGEMVEISRQAAAAERADTFHIPEFPDMSEYQNPVCRGSLALGNACRRCERCLDTIKELEGFGTPPEPHPSGDTPLVTGTIDTTKLQTPVSMGWPSNQPNPNVHEGLPVADYKKEQPAWAVALVNQHKILEEALLRQLDHLKVKYSTKLEEAFYHMNRAVFQPQRLEGLDADKANAILRAAGSRAAMTPEELSS